MPTPPAPIVVIHGSWIRPSSRQHWIELLEEAGHGPGMTAWPGVTDTVEATRAPDQPAPTADQTVAQAREDTALRAARRGGIAEAVTALEHAAVLSGDAARRTERLLRAADCAVELSRPEAVNRMLDRAQTTTLSPRQHATVVWLRGSFNEGLGGPPRSVVSLTALAESIAADDRTRAGLNGRSKG